MPNQWMYVLLPILLPFSNALFAEPLTSHTNELTRLQASYACAVAAIDARYATLQTNSRAQYYRSLDLLENSYQQEGDFRALMAVREEKVHFSRELSAPGPDVDGEPVKLRSLKAKMRTAPAEFDAQRKKETGMLIMAYLARLEALQRYATRQGRIVLAAEVQAEIDKIRPPSSALAQPTQIGETVNPKTPAPLTSPAGEGEAPRVPTPSEGPKQRVPSGPIRSGPTLGGRVTEESLVALLERCRDISGARALSRVVDGRTTLSGKYYAANGLLVEKAGTLTLDPGTVIVMPPGSEIRVEGNMRVRGSPGKWVVVCCEEKGASRWDGFFVVSVEAAKYGPLDVSGLVVADAKTGMDIVPVRPYEDRQFEFSDCVFFGNGVGMKAGRHSSGVQPSGAIRNSLFLRNTSDALYTASMPIPTRTPRVSYSTFAGNGVAIDSCGSGSHGSGSGLADHCLFVQNGIGVKGDNREGVVSSCIFQENGVDLQLLRDNSTIVASGNYWGADTTKLLNASEGADSGGKISRSATIKGWLQKAPTSRAGADFWGP